MKTAVIKGYIYWRKTVYVYDEANAFQFYPFDMDGWSEKEKDGRVKVGPHTIIVEIPEDFNPIPAQLAALDAKEHQLKADFAKAMMELADDRAKLLAITNEVAA